MDTPRDDRLAEDLRALRPAPRPEFAAKLDERAAAGFPRRSRLPQGWLERLRAIKPRKMLIPAGGIAAVAIAVVTALVIGGESRLNVQAGGERDLGQRVDSGAGSQAGAKPHTQYEDTVGGVVPEAEGLSSPSAATGVNGRGQRPHEINRLSGAARHRAVERSAELVLAASSADLADDSSQVFDAVHANNGIVMRSSTREGEAGEAGARFELLIPSARLGDALAALSAIDEVRSRHEATSDITAPTVTTGELLRDSKARIDSLLAQLEAAGSASEREAVEAELVQERRHRSRLRAQLQRLQRRADYSRVLVRIETGAAEESSGAAWGVGDALDDAGKILAVAAAVAVVALAVLGPIALIALLAWLTHRAWVRHERRRVLG